MWLAIGLKMNINTLLFVNFVKDRSIFGPPQSENNKKACRSWISWNQCSSEPESSTRDTRWQDGLDQGAGWQDGCDQAEDQSTAAHQAGFLFLFAKLSLSSSSPNLNLSRWLIGAK